jgi:glutamine amidotransferase
MIGIIDIGIGNIRSIKNWLDRCIMNWEIINDPKVLVNYSLIILPGVGSASLFINELKKSGFFIELKNSHARGQRILGICLGAQVFMDYLEEDGGIEGLGFIKGNVIKLPLNDSNTGWLPFTFNVKNLSPMWLKSRNSTSQKISLTGRVFYNHNYGLTLTETNTFNQVIDLGSLSSFSSVIHKNNVLGLQFHPEKSQELGEQLLKVLI